MMNDHSENTLGAAIKSLRDTVAPAVDPEDGQAQEQLRLTIDFLEFLRSRFYDLHARHRFELGHQIDVAESLVDDARRISPDVGRPLADALAGARRSFADPASHTRELRSASEQLWGAVRTVVRKARGATEDVRNRVSATVLTGVDPLVEMESAWYLPFGFEPDPGSIPSVGALLSPVGHGSGHTSGHADGHDD